MKKLGVGQNCSIDDAELSAPRQGDVEITILGKGVGECIVIKTATNKIIIVDSFINDETKRPIALEYLERIGIPLESIKCLILTHFHDDHIKGAYQILESTSFEAKLVVNPFIGHIQILKAITEKMVKSNGDPLSGVTEIGFLLSKMNGRLKLECASINKTLFVDEDDKDFSIVSLSPHDSELMSYLNSLADDDRKTILEKYGSNKENIYSVVLLVRTKNRCFLLGGDYPDKQGVINEGWSIVAEEYVRAYGCKSSVFKVPHHGSHTSQNDKVWETMLEQNPISVATVFNKGHKVPKDEEILWILNKTNVFYLNGGYKTDSEMERVLGKTLEATDVFVKSGKIGLTRIIFGDNNSSRFEFVGAVSKYE